MTTTRRNAIKTVLYTATAYVANPFTLSSSLYAGSQNVQKKPQPQGPFELPALNYSFGALEPHIDAQTMQLHHNKHHQSYVNKLNQVIASHNELSKKSVEQLLRNLNDLPEAIREEVRNHGGGHANHTLLWKQLAPGGEKQPQKRLAKAIDKKFGSFAQFEEKFQTRASKLFGSGWVWFSLDKNKELQLESLPNQDSPLLFGQTPLMGIDVWEHAYYLKYQNRRADYIKAFAKVINWTFVTHRYENLIA